MKCKEKPFHADILTCVAGPTVRTHARTHTHMGAGSCQMEAAADDTCFVSQAYGTLGKKTQPCLEPFFLNLKTT